MTSNNLCLFLLLSFIFPSISESGLASADLWGYYVTSSLGYKRPCGSCLTLLDILLWTRAHKQLCGKAHMGRNWNFHWHHLLAMWAATWKVASPAPVLLKSTELMVSLVQAEVEIQCRLFQMLHSLSVSSLEGRKARMLFLLIKFWLKKITLWKFIAVMS